MSQVTIIDYKSGNIASILNALKKIGIDAIVTSDAKQLQNAERIILPGVGRAGFAMKQLKNSDLIAVLKTTTVPLLGICLGMQLLSEWSEEDNTPGLAIIPGKVKKFIGEVKVPHIGWNKVFIKNSSPLLQGIPDQSYFYFVNSYYHAADPSTLLANSYYEIEFSTIVQFKNFFGVQFHPEKSSALGLKLLKNFCTLC